MGPGAEESPPASPSASQRRPEVNRQRRASTAHTDLTGPPMVPGYLPPDQRGTHRAGLGARARGALPQLSCGNIGPGLLRVRDGGPWHRGSSGTKEDACLLSQKIGRGAGWSFQVRGNREGQQRPTCRPTGPGPWTGPAVLRRADAVGLGSPEAWEEPVHRGRPPGLGLKTLQAPRAGAEEPRPWMFTDGPHGGTGHLGPPAPEGSRAWQRGQGAKHAWGTSAGSFPSCLPPHMGHRGSTHTQGAWQGSRHPPAASQRVGRPGVRGYDTELLIT